MRYAKDNPFKNYLGFLKKLNEEEMALCNGIGYEFIKLIEIRLPQSHWL